MSGTSLDTNVILRLVVKDVPTQTRAATEFVRRSRCYVTDVVITEAVYALERLYLLERSEIAAALQYVFRSSSIDYNADLIDEVFTLYQNRKPLSFVDCYVKLEASGRDADVATFDKKLIKEGAHIREPQ